MFGARQAGPLPKDHGSGSSVNSNGTDTSATAVGTSQITIQANLSRITDARTYDQLASGLPTFDLIRSYADRIAKVLRDQTAPQAFPAQRSDLAVS